MDLTEAKQILNEKGYELLDEGKFGRALGAIGLAIGSLVHGAEYNLDNYNKEEYVKLSFDEVPKELDISKSNTVYFNTETNKYTVLKDVVTNYGDIVKGTEYDSNLKWDKFLEYDENGELVEMENESGKYIFQAPSLANKFIKKINNDLDLNIKYKEKISEKDISEKTGFKIFEDGEIYYFVKGLPVFSIVSTKNEKSFNTLDLFTYNKNGDVTKQISYYSFGDDEFEEIASYINYETKDWKEYYPNGTYKFIGKVDNNGKQHGTFTSYYKNGKKAGISQYSHGKHISTKCTDGRIGNKNLQCQIEDD